MQTVREKFADEVGDGLYLIASPTIRSFSFFLLWIESNILHLW